MYSKQAWADSPATTSPLNAARLNHMEDGIEAAHPLGSAITSELNLNTSTTETTIITSSSLSALLAVGSTWRFSIRGSVQVQATSGILTFRDYLGANVSAETFVMATQTSAAGPVGFELRVDCTIRTIGASGTYISHGYGRMDFATPVAITTTTTSTAVIDTTVANPTVKLTAQWATSSATNILKIETATLERVA